jgi:hypothetical protein
MAIRSTFESSLPRDYSCCGNRGIWSQSLASERIPVPAILRLHVPVNRRIVTQQYQNSLYMFIFYLMYMDPSLKIVNVHNRDIEV